MYIIKNALQNLVLNRGRNLMIAAIIFVIIFSVVIAFEINGTTNGAINNFESQFGSLVNFMPNTDAMLSEYGTAAKAMGSNIPAASPDDLIRFGQSDYLQKTVYEASAGVNSEQLNAIDARKGGGPSMAGGQVYFNLLGGNTDTAVYSDFTNGLRKLTDGSRYPANDNECLISEELLQNSGLSIGDTINITSKLDMMSNGLGSDNITDVSWNLTIVGTYNDLTQAYSVNTMPTAFSNRRNEILTTFNTMASKVVPGNVGINVYATFYLKNPNLLNAFTQEVRAKGLSNLYDVTTDATLYNEVVKPVETLKTIFIVFVIIILVLGATILSLLTSIAIRERKYEIGVLRAMGMKKRKVLAGLWIETLGLTIICFILGLSIGSLVAQPITNMILNKMISGNSVIGSPVTMTTIETIKNLTVSLSLMTILEITGITLALTSLSAIIATRKITKYEPIKILMERN